MKKALMFLSFLWGLFTTDVHAIEFSIHETGRTYTVNGQTNQYAEFLTDIRNLFCNFPNLPAIHINVISDNDEVTTLTINFTSSYCLYITQINGVDLMDREITYDSVNQWISYQDINDAISAASSFSRTNRANVGRIVKILACVISEAVRFQRVQGLVNGTIVNMGEYWGFWWSVIDAEIHEWSPISANMSSLGVFEGRGRAREGRRGGYFYVAIPEPQARRVEYFLEVSPFLGQGNWRSEPSMAP